MRGVERELGARQQADQRARQDDEQGAEERQRPQQRPDEAANRVDRAARRRGEPEPRGQRRRDQQGQGEQGDRPARHQVAGEADVASGPCSTAPGDGVEGEDQRERGAAEAVEGVACRRTRACRCRGIDGQLAVGREPDGRRPCLDQRALLAEPGRQREPEEVVERALVPGRRRRARSRRSRSAVSAELAGGALRSASTRGSPAEAVGCARAGWLSTIAASSRSASL